MKMEKDIPPPNSGRRGPGQKSEDRAALDTMDVGESFETQAASIHAAIQNSQRVNGRKYTTRKSENGYRVWRIK